MAAPAITAPDKAVAEKAVDIRRAPASSLSGPQKAAVLLLQLGAAKSAKILQMLSEAELAELGAEIAKLSSVEGDIVDNVFQEFRGILGTRPTGTTGGLNVAVSLLEEGLGRDKADPIIERITHKDEDDLPFAFLREADPKQVVGFLQEEHPQVTALVLAYLPADNAAAIIGALPDEMRRVVAHRLAVMDTASPEIVQEVEQQLRRKLSTVLAQAGKTTTIGGVQSLVDILNRSERTTERAILEWMDESNPELAEEIRRRMFVFADVVNLDDRSVQLVLRQVDARQLALALKGTAPEVKEKIGRNMSQRAAQNLLEEIEMLGPVRLKNVEEAQMAIVAIIRSLEEDGQIVLTRGGDEFVT